MKIERFLCNGEARCIHVDEFPRFSWRITGQQSQKSYQLLVFDAGICVYDSGRIESKIKTHVARFALEACKEYTARLTVVSRKTTVAAECTFRTALLQGF